MSKYVDMMYSDEKIVLIKSLESRSGISLTTDIWTSAATECHFTLIVHFIDESWKCVNCVLAGYL